MTMETNTRGFTLVELLVVISIISLLSSVVLTSVNSARAKARDARRRADVNQVKLALELYYDANNKYPSQGGANVGDYWSTVLTPYLVPTYLPQMPQDPRGEGYHIYQYVHSPDANGYGIWVRFEDIGYCRTGVNMNSGWWGAPACPF